MHCRPVHKGQGCWPEFSVMQPPSWNLQARNVESPLCWRRKPSPWARNLSSWRPQRLSRPSQYVWRSLSLQNPLSGLMFLLPLLLCPSCQNLAATPPRRQRNPSEGLKLTQVSLMSGSGPMLQKMKGYLTGGGNFSLFSTPRMSTSMMLKLKN